MQPPAKAQVKSIDLADIDTVIHNAVTAGDPLIAAEYGNQIIATVRLKGVSLAKLFHGMKTNWELFQRAGIEEEFTDFVNAHMRFDGATANKYAAMYESVLENKSIPAATRKQLQSKSIETLLLLTAAVREGDLGPDELETVVVLDHGKVQQMVRKARGDVTSSRSAVYARLITEPGKSHPVGTLVVYGTDGDGNIEIEPIGRLNIDPETESAKKFLARTVRKMNLAEGTNGQS